MSESVIKVHKTGYGYCRDNPIKVGDYESLKDYIVLSADVRDSTYAFYQVGDIIDDNYIVVYFE